MNRLGEIVAYLMVTAAIALGGSIVIFLLILIWNGILALV